MGPDRAALARLRAHFDRPKEAMGEAWFMGEERHFYHELNGDLDSLSTRDIQRPLEEIASGTSAFGPRLEWHLWYHYLLGQLIPRAHENFVNSLLESLITCFMALHPTGVRSAPYPEFLNDALLTLGRSMMDERCWDGKEIMIGEMLHRSNNNPNQVWCWWDASGDFSASLFFCLKYLPSPLVSDWFRSVLDIPSPHWRAQVLVWLVGAHDILMGRVSWPEEFVIGARPSIDWEWSHCLRPELAIADEADVKVASPPFLPAASRAHVLELAHSYFTEDVFIEWLASISDISYLETELAELPSSFEQLYVRRQ